MKDAKFSEWERLGHEIDEGNKQLEELSEKEELIGKIEELQSCVCSTCFSLTH